MTEARRAEVTTTEKRPPRLLLRENPLGSCHPGGTFLNGYEPAIHLSGIPRNALQTTFNGGRLCG